LNLAGSAGFSPAPHPMSTTSRHLCCAAAFGVLLFTALCAQAAETAKPKSPFTYSGDLRLRYEWDWDSKNGSGVARANRDRARYRARASIGYKFSDTWSFGARARTGNRDSQQSPHLTFHANDDITDDFEVALDRYYLQMKEGVFTGWLGRNTTPFWQQNEMFWDEDVTPTGVAGTYESKLEQGSVATTVGAFFMPDGAVDLNGTLVGAQLKYSRSVKPAQFTLAGGFYRHEGKGGAANLRNRNGARDYLLGVLSAQWSTALDNGRSLVFGADFIRNFADYSAADVAPFTVNHADETNGYVYSVLYGRLSQPRDWQVGWFYAHIETLAVNAAYSQDDWARFGSATQSDVTDFKGHELRATYVITKTMNVQARLFFVEAITSVQDGKRLRVDLNWRF
jgi:hypothetical protein